MKLGCIFKTKQQQKPEAVNMTFFKQSNNEY